MLRESWKALEPHHEVTFPARIVVAVTLSWLFLLLLSLNFYFLIVCSRQFLSSLCDLSLLEHRLE